MFPLSVNIVLMAIAIASASTAMGVAGVVAWVDIVLE